MPRWMFISVAAVLAITTLAARQQVFRTAVEYVSVDVVVTDKNDKPVTDLTKDEFVIKENNKAQTIRDFQYVSVPVEHRTVDVAQPQPPEPDVVTNMPPTPKSRLFAVVIDDLHLIEQDIIPIKRVLTDFVESVSPDDEVAMVFVGRSDLSINFTQNTGRLLATIENVRKSLGFGLDALAQEPAAGASPTASGAIAMKSAPIRLNYARSAAMTLGSVAASLAGSGHSRRAIIYVSDGTTLSPVPTLSASDGPDSMTLRDELDKTYDAARRADVPIYTVDPRGGATPEDSVRGGISVIHDYTIRKLVADNIRIQQDYNSEVAINTGGRAFINASDLKRAVQEIVGENGSYYLLGYSPDPVVHDGKYHDIDVKVTRPGLIVRPRKGYVAASAVAATTDVKPTLDKAMAAGVNVSGLSLRGFAAPVVSTPTGMTTVVTVKLTYPAPADGSKDISDNMEMSLIALDPDGKVKASSARTLHFQSSVPDGADSVSILIDDTIALPSQPLTLRVGLASKALGRAGTIQLPVDVPKPSDSKLQMGGVAIGFADFGREPTLQRDLISSLVPFQPTTTRTFAAKDTLRVFDRLFWGSKDADADVTITIVGAASRVPVAVHVAGAPSASNSSRLEGTLTTLVPLSGLAAGDYTLRVEARIANGQTARREVAFEVK